MQFGKRVLPHLRLDGNWKSRIVSALRREQDPCIDDSKVERLQRALDNLRKQHLWGDLSDEKYLHDRQGLERQLKALASSTASIHIPNLKRAAQLLEDLSSLWDHPGVTNHQREALIRETFVRILIGGRELMAIEPKPLYAPLFATLVTSSKVGYHRPDSSRPDQPSETLQLLLMELPQVE
jgi:hypothetical protein